jgi:hypothetical protein
VKLTVFLGVLLGLLVAFPALAEPITTVAHWLVLQPLVWAFATGVIARPRIAQHLPRRLR